MTQSKRKTKRTDYPPEVLKAREDFYKVFCEDNPDLRGAERKKAWNRFMHKHFWSYVYKRVGQEG